MLHIETPRTMLRPFTDADAEAAFAWFSDHDVMRFTPSGPDRTIAHTRERLAKYWAHQVRHGFSKWLIVEQGSGAAIGDAGLQLLPELGSVPDLGFRLLPSHWRRGLATEVATAWIRVALDVHRFHRLGAFAHVDNVGSHRVLEKVGFHRTGHETVMGMNSFTYVLVRSCPS